MGNIDTRTKNGFRNTRRSFLPCFPAGHAARRWLRLVSDNDLPRAGI